MKRMRKPNGIRALLLTLLAFYTAAAFLPCIAFQLQERRPPSPESSYPGFLASSPESSSREEARERPEGDSFLLYDTGTNTLLPVSAEEYVAAALACEMDLSTPKAALQAQAIALYTLARYKRDYGEPINGGDFLCNTETWSGYTTQEQMKARWGEDFDEYYALLTELAQSVKGITIIRENKPIQAAFFAISCGNTEDAEFVWGPLPYLTSVPSPGDAFCDGYLTKASFTPEEITTALSSFSDSTNTALPREEWFQGMEHTPAGYVKSLSVLGVSLSGVQLREALDLRSACFTIDYIEEGFQFTCRGWGHGVGMSQAGAAFLAKRGADYEKILSHYYPGTSLSQNAG